MKRLILGLVMAVSAFPVIGQNYEIEREVVASGGAYREFGDYSLSYTIGQLVTETLSNSNLAGQQVDFSQGFQQGALIMTSTEHALVSLVRFEAYPNPTPDKIFIELNSDKAVVVELVVMDLAGRQVPISRQKFRFVGTEKRQLDLTNLADGVYIVAFLDENRELVRSVKIEKIH
ncbi:T9SS type A sorting domain-containing protein [Pontibacter sp. G13]|uniref:T9SS type A sorting domain-containing protein n=1 Tax=Pontibacter sp. G13 TaxID=3074898 RepID=UPI00288AF99B|nr:T9SS type A sorting domain-containing protein [Pontibacter sp. G13]WNJ19199.1 T9SS type A sorting domain-containing protein [Pontibacter sp. G13]